MKVPIEDIEKKCIAALVAKGYDEEDAKEIVDEYIDGELRGRKCHGVSMFPKFAYKASEKRQGKYKLEKEGSSYLKIDGMGNKVPIILRKYLPRLIEMAKEAGVSMLGIHNAVTYLMPGTYARKIAEQDMIGLIFNYGGWPRIAPTGSIDPMFGTNPVGIGIPSDTIPIVVDMGTSEQVMGKVRMADRLDEDLPEGVAVDSDGNATIDPKAAMDGALLPFGGHKGYALALVIEILTKTLFDIDHKEEGKANRGFMFIVIDPASFGDVGAFKKRVSKLINEIKSCRKDGVDEIFVPGERSERTKQENLSRGFVEIDDKFMEDLEALQ